MPQCQQVDPVLADIFHALADPTRLAVVERLSVSAASASELAKSFEMALPSFMQHMGVLERGGIVTSHKNGRIRTISWPPARCSSRRRGWPNFATIGNAGSTSWTIF